MDNSKHGEEEEEEILIQTFSKIQKCVIILDSWDILLVNVIDWKGTSEETQEEDLEVSQ